MYIYMYKYIDAKRPLWLGGFIIRYTLANSSDRELKRFGIAIQPPSSVSN